MFDRYVESKRHSAAGRARRIVIAGSVVIHVVAVGALVTGSLLRVEEMKMADRPLFAGPIVALPGGPTPPTTNPDPRKRPAKRIPRPNELVQPTRESKSNQSNSIAEPALNPDPGGANPGGGGEGPQVPSGTVPCVGDDCVKEGSGGETPKPQPIRKVPSPQPDQWLEQQTPGLPDDVKMRLRGTGEKWIAVLCAGVDGRITQIQERHNIVGAEEVIRAGVSRWRLKPQSVPICFPVIIDYTIE